MLAAAHRRPLFLVMSCFAYMLLPATAGDPPPPLLPLLPLPCCCTLLLFPKCLSDYCKQADQSVFVVAILNDKVFTVAVTWKACDGRHIV